MILARQEAHKVVPLISNMDAYDAYLELLRLIQEQYYKELLSAQSSAIVSIQSKLQLIEELKQLRDRLKDTLNV